jgi:hypothetical protein
MKMEREMTQAEATSIISAYAKDHDSGILETLEYMKKVYDYGFHKFAETFTAEECKAYWIVMEGMREMFYGSEVTSA